MLQKKLVKLFLALREGQWVFILQILQQMMKNFVLPSQEGSTFQSRVLRKLEKALVVILPFASPPRKCAYFLGAMLPLLPSMEIHYEYNFTKKKAKHHLHI